MTRQVYEYHTRRETLLYRTLEVARSKKFSPAFYRFENRRERGERIDDWKIKKVVRQDWYE